MPFSPENENDKDSNRRQECDHPQLAAMLRGTPAARHAACSDHILHSSPEGSLQFTRGIRVRLQRAHDAERAQSTLHAI